MENIKMYENGLAVKFDGAVLGKCSVPNFDNQSEMLEHGFTSNDVETDNVGRFISVDSREYGFDNKLTIKLSTTSLRELILEQMLLAESFEWTGWRIPIYLDNISKDDIGEQKYTFSAGSWLSNNSWQPDVLEVYKIESWNIDEDGLEEGFDKDEEVAYQADYLLDGYWDDLVDQVEENIKHFLYDYDQKEVEIIWE